MSYFSAVTRRPVQGGVQLPQSYHDPSHHSLVSTVSSVSAVQPGKGSYTQSHVATVLAPPPSQKSSRPSLSLDGPEPRISSLKERFEKINDIGDGSFGSVVRACERRRPGSQKSTRQSAYFAIKIIKKPFSSLRECNELREVIFLRTLPTHHNLVPALDIFLDRSTRQLHIVMEYMDCNLYQLMKNRDGNPFPVDTVRSILRQIMTGLLHIHSHEFFHRDIKPENILVSPAASDNAASLESRRYSTALMTPPSTPQTYIVKLADFGLAREIGAASSYTTYVSTRWYRAPEVLFHAKRYSAPVDIWAVGAMAAEIATLKPLFPGSNEVDQVYRVCVIRGCPDGQLPSSARTPRTSVIGRHMLMSTPAVPVGGGEWQAGVEMAYKVGVKLYRTVPRALTDVLGSSFPKEFYDFIDWCLKWDPANRPTSQDALDHPYLSGGTGTSQSGRLSSRRTIENLSFVAQSSRTSWFKRTLGVSLTSNSGEPKTDALTERSANVEKKPAQEQKEKSSRRTTWASGFMGGGLHKSPVIAAAQPSGVDPSSESAKLKLARQPSVASHNQVMTELHRQEAERALNGQVPPPVQSSVTAGSIVSPPSTNQRESFFSHLRKRARRMSGRPSLPMSPEIDVGEEGGVSVGCAPWATSANRNSLAPNPLPDSAADSQKHSRQVADPNQALEGSQKPKQLHRLSATSLLLRRRSQRQSVPCGQNFDASSATVGSVSSVQSSATGRAGRRHLASTVLSPKYDIPVEADEMKMEYTQSTTPQSRASHLTYTSATDQQQQQQPRHLPSIHINTYAVNGYQNPALHNYPTPSHSATGGTPTWSNAGVPESVNPLSVKPSGDSLMQSHSHYHHQSQQSLPQVSSLGQSQIPISTQSQAQLAQQKMMSHQYSVGVPHPANLLSPVSPAMSVDNYKTYSYQNMGQQYGVMPHHQFLPRQSSLSRPAAGPASHPPQLPALGSNPNVDLENQTPSHDLFTDPLWTTGAR